MAPTGEGPVRIVAMGDSTTAGTPGFLSPIEAPPDGRGDERSQYPYWLMREHPEWVVLNRGVNGERSDQILARFRRDVLAPAPRAVVILAGVNDVYQGYPQGFTQGNLVRMYDLAGEARISTVACTILPYNSMGRREAKARGEVNHWIASECRRRGTSFCDTAKAVEDDANPDRLRSTNDGLHPDVEGYRRMAVRIAKVLERVLDSNPSEP